MRSIALAGLLVLAVTAAAGAKDKKFDDGRLEPSWFGAVTGDWREADEIDYLWVRPGAALEGRSLAFAPWPDPVWLGDDERDAKDKRLAKEISADMPGVLAEAFSNAFGSRLTVVESGEQVRVEGRMVDCSTGSEAAKFWVGMGAGAGVVVVDLKFVDAASGELLAAVHHRAVSGTNWSTSDSKIVDWADEMADQIAKKGFETLYKKGDKQRD
jgi:hypothetical protein